MTNDELNYWLCLWYHQEILGNCVHVWKWKAGSAKCIKCGIDRPYGYRQEKIPDYLSDPAVFRDIIEELIKAKYHLRYSGKVLNNKDFYYYCHDGYELLSIGDESLERAVMLAYKKKVKNET